MAGEESEGKGRKGDKREKGKMMGKDGEGKWREREEAQVGKG